MKNKEVFEKYNDQNFIIEQQIYFAIVSYWEEYCEKYSSRPPHNVIDFVKKWMKEDSYTDTSFVDLARKKEQEEKAEIIDVEFSEAN